MARDRTHRDGDDGQHATPPKQPPALHAGRCSWITRGRQCHLVGEMSSDIGDKLRLYCNWHFVCKQSGPQWAEDEQEFRRWQEAWARYCCVENHYDAAMIWDALQGITPLAGKPRWCGLVVCRHVPVSDSWRWIREGKGHQPNSREIEAAAANAKPAGPLWTPRDLTPRARAAREALGIADPVPIEVTA